MTINSLKIIERRPNYDTINNPLHLTVYDLLPIGIEWTHLNKSVKIKNDAGLIYQKLTSEEGLSIVEDPFSRNGQNKAYIVNEDGAVRCRIYFPGSGEFCYFNDTYYVENELSFF